MTAGIDACLEKISGDLYDIAIDSNGDIRSEDMFDTAILVSLFAERRADESEVFESHVRRGWIGNEDTPGFEIGSKIWLYEQARLTRSTLNGIAVAARQSLQWLIDDNHANTVHIHSIDVLVTNDGIQLEIEIHRPNSKVEKRYYMLWDKTAIKCIDQPKFFSIAGFSGMNVFHEIGYPNYPVDVIVNFLNTSLGNGTFGFYTGEGWHPNSTITLYIEAATIMSGGGGAGGAGGGNTGTGNIGGGGGGAASFGAGGLSDDGAHNGSVGGTVGAGAGSVGAATGAVSTHAAQNGQPGFPAIIMKHKLSVINKGIIAGGGGGGGGGGANIGTGGAGGTLSAIGANGSGTSPGVGGAAGNAIEKNGNALTLIETGTIAGAIV